jgi:hypothetical protein
VDGAVRQHTYESRIQVIYILDDYVDLKG